MVRLIENCFKGGLKEFWNGHSSKNRDCPAKKCADEQPNYDSIRRNGKFPQFKITAD
jgi:hypothetical protein